ncbi:MAG: FAD-dependent 5-carboxymethylaminomethyl-2-thiouridine(34) oxidoreductase MnmC, partial [Pseudomonadales bacterium]
YARLSPHASPLNDFALAAYLYALRYYREYFAQCGQQSGLLQLLATADQENAYASLLKQCNDNKLMRYCDQNEASAIAGVEIAKSAVYYPQAGWLQPRSLCSRLVDHPNIRVCLNTSVRGLQQKAGRWHFDHAGDQVVTETDSVIIAMGHHSNALPSTAFLPLKAIRGQVSYLHATTVSTKLRSVVCERSFITPAHNGVHTVGASYNLAATNMELSEQDHRHNMQQLGALLPGVTTSSPAALQGRVGFRCVAPDYLPVVGPVPHQAAFERDYAPLGKDAKATVARVSEHAPGLYVNSAFGSRAYCFAPLCAELLVSQISGETAPLPAYISRALLPGRFIVRNIIHGR